MTEEQQPSLPPMIDRIGIAMVQYPDMVKMQEIIEERERESAENEKIYNEAMEKRKQKGRESVNPDDTEEEINRRKMEKTLHRINKNNQNNNEE